MFYVYNRHLHFLSFGQPGKSLGADPVNGAGEKTVGNRCISRLQKYKKRSIEKYHTKINQKNCLNAPGRLVDFPRCGARGEHYLRPVQTGY